MPGFSRTHGLKPVGFVIVIFLYTMIGTTIWADEQVREAFLRLYQPHAAKLQRDYANIKIRYKDTYNLGNGRLQVSEMEGKYNFPNGYLGGEIRLIDDKTPNKPVKTYKQLECFNANYSFTLSPGLDNQYKVDRLSFGDPGALCFFLAPCAEYQIGKTFLDMARDPSVSFISFSDGNWEGRQVKILKLKFKRRFRDSKKDTEMNPSYFFVPEEGWICHGVQYDTSDPNVVYEKRYFFTPKNGDRYPDLKSIEGWIKNIKDPKDSQRKHLTEIIEYVHSPPFPESDFTLSAFGLPDPIDAPAPPRSRSWLWLIGGAVASTVLAILFAWLKKRRRTRVASP